MAEKRGKRKRAIIELKGIEIDGIAARISVELKKNVVEKMVGEAKFC
jgi:hypothetical protein